MPLRWSLILPSLALALFAYVCFPSKATRSAEEGDVREAVFRYQFEHNSSGQQKKAAVYCLSVGENTDPSDDFIRRFANHKPPVRKISQCDVGPFDGVVDKLTHKLGLVFRVSSIKWISETEVEASGGYYEAGLSASGDTYTVRKWLGKWRVTKDKMNWISKNLEAPPFLAVAKSRFSLIDRALSAIA